jgi:hypothetical protein
MIVLCSGIMFLPERGALAHGAVIAHRGFAVHAAQALASAREAS